MRPYTYRILQCFLASVFLLSCSDNLSEAPETSAAQGLSLAFNLNGGSAESSPGSDGLKENTVNSLDVLFVKGTAVEKHFSYTYSNSQLSSGSVQIAGNGWKKNFQGEYEVYLVANYDGDLSSVTTKSQLFATVDQDENITKAEGEQSVDEVSKYIGKSFLMDGKTTFNADSDYGPTNQHTIDVNLSRAAAKITVNLAYGNGFLQTESGDSRSIVSVQKKLVRYVNEAKIVADGGTIPFADLHGNSDNTGFSYANVSEGEGTAGRKDVLYTYCYPNDWTDDIEGRETYLLLNIPYTEGSDQGNVINNYYKIPVRISGVTQQLSIERNTEYTIDVNINRVGSIQLEEPQELIPQISVTDWVSKEINVSDKDTPKYLELNKTNFEMRNISEASVTFSSSSALQGVTVNRVYFINKLGQEKEIDNTTVTTSYDSSSLQGNITVKSPVPGNATVRYIELTVKNNDNLTQKMTISQYPLEYIVGIPGIYSYRDNMTNNTYENYLNGYEFDDGWVGYKEATFGSYYNEENLFCYYGFNSRIFSDNQIRNITLFKQDNGKYRLGISQHAAGTRHNNRMYLVNITSTEDGVTIARPDMEKTSDGLVVPVSSDENNTVVSPSFMLASQLNSIYVQNDGGTWVSAQEHCARYVEVIEYTDKTTRVLDDWRLPSHEELKIIDKYQNSTPDVMDEILSDPYYWTLQDSQTYQTSSPTTGIGTKAKAIRCIRDVTIKDLDEFRKKGFKI